MQSIKKVYQSIFPLEVRHRLYRIRKSVIETLFPGTLPPYRRLDNRRVKIRTIPPELSPVLEALKPLPSLWHEAGTLSYKTLEAIAHHLHALDMPIRHSIETGCGKSTVLLSHISAHHQVFALSASDNSWQQVLDFPVLKKENIELIDGPTQRTLPTHRFEHKLQFALIDGPHGYPFPDLEYYYIYPQLAENALLVVDDIHIPNIKSLFEFLCADEMFTLKEVVSTTAIFQRTSAPTFDPTGDGWWLQGYNRKVAEHYIKNIPTLTKV
jgi:hypothetical protein